MDANMQLMGLENTISTNKSICCALKGFMDTSSTFLLLYPAIHRNVFYSSQPFDLQLHPRHPPWVLCGGHTSHTSPTCQHTHT